MGVHPRLHRLALAAGGVVKLAGQPDRHRLAFLASRGLDDPAEGQALAAAVGDLHRHLVVGAAHAAGANLDRGPHVAQRLMEKIERALGKIFGLILVQPDLDLVEGFVDHALGDGFLALIHDAVDELGQHLVLVAGVGTELLF